MFNIRKNSQTYYQNKYSEIHHVLKQNVFLNYSAFIINLIMINAEHNITMIEEEKHGIRLKI